MSGDKADFFMRKVAATLDTPPPMLYNGVVAGKHPAIVNPMEKTPPSSR